MKKMNIEYRILNNEYRNKRHNEKGDVTSTFEIPFIKPNVVKGNMRDKQDHLMPTNGIIEGIRGRDGTGFCQMSYPMRPSVALLEERLTVPPAPRAAEPRAPPERYRGLATRGGTLTES